MKPPPLESLSWCLKRLSRSDQTERQLRDSLARRGAEEEEVDQALAWLKARGLLSDQRTGARHVEVARSRRLMGEEGIRSELESMGLDPVAFLSESEEEEAEEERAKTLLQARLKPGDGPAKAARVLASKGFGEEVIRSVLASRYPELDF